jgi:hypothetical protein
VSDSKTSLVNMQLVLPAGAILSLRRGVITRTGASRALHGMLCAVFRVLYGIY